jgi:hypothetical protein
MMPPIRCEGLSQMARLAISRSAAILIYLATAGMERKSNEYQRIIVGIRLIG